MKTIKPLNDFFQSLGSYLSFLKLYFQKRFYQLFRRFETSKGFLVGGLVAKRGKYVRPFLHSSMSGVFLIGLSLAPLIKSALPQKELGRTVNPTVLAQTTLDESITTKISLKPRDSVVVYTIRPGDTISSVAQKFGVSETTILWENNLQAKSVIKPGEKLKIPPVSGIVHKVKRGETIYSIAKKYSVDPQGIVNWPFNTFSNDETFALAVGQILIVPDGVKPKEAPPKKYLAFRKKTPSAGAVSATGSFVWPTSGVISQYFKWYHRAIDIANPSAPPVLAADSGKVIAVLSYRYGYGNHILIDHGNGYITLYAHLSAFNVSQGQTVKRGDVIGRMGSTGRSTGTHLHFEIRKNGVNQNPLLYLK